MAIAKYYAVIQVTYPDGGDIPTVDQVADAICIYEGAPFELFGAIVADTIEDLSEPVA